MLLNFIPLQAADLNRISLASWDWIVIAIFFLAMVWICYDVSRKKKETSGDYFLSGRSATWIAIGASIFASNIGSEHLIGLAGTGASAGMAQAHWEIQGWMILILGWVFVPFYERSMVYTMPEFLEKRYNKESRGILTWLSLASYVLTKVSVTVLAGGLALNTLLGINFWVAALALVIITAIYTVIGGMESVLKTSVLQTPILLLGSLVILWLGLKELGGWNTMMSICDSQPVNQYGDTMTDLMRSGKDSEFPWYGALFGSAIIGFWYWCTDQFIVQRVLSGKNQKESRRGTIFGAYLKLLPVFLFLIPGMIAYALTRTPDSAIGQQLAVALGLQADGTVANPDIAFPMLVNTLLPVGLKGVVICGILAALMSSLASLYNSSAMLYTIDIYKRKHPETEEKKLVRIGRIATVDRRGGRARRPVDLRHPEDGQEPVQLYPERPEPPGPGHCCSVPPRYLLEEDLSQGRYVDPYRRSRAGRHPSRDDDRQPAVTQCLHLHLQRAERVRILRLDVPLLLPAPVHHHKVHPETFRGADPRPVLRHCHS